MFGRMDGRTVGWVDGCEDGEVAPTRPRHRNIASTVIPKQQFDMACNEWSKMLPFAFEIAVNVTIFISGL